MLSDHPIDPPYESVGNPLAVPALGAVAAAVREIGAMLTAIGLLVGAASLVVRFTRSSGGDRLQLLWMVLAAAPLPLFVLASFLFRDVGNQAPQLLATAGWIVVIPVATVLSITRYHLFEVERNLSRTFTYVLLSVLVVATYAVVVHDKTIESHISMIFSKLGLLPEAEVHRRVLAVLTWLQRP